MEDRIVLDPEVCHGKPVISRDAYAGGPRRGQSGRGMSFEDVQREYDLTIEDVRAALRYVGELLDRERHYPPTA